MATTSPFDSWPKAKRSVRKDGTAQTLVCSTYLTPWAKRLADWISVGSIPLTAVAAGYGIYSIGPDADAANYCALAAFPPIAFCAARFFFYNLFQMSKTVTFTPDEIVVQGWLRNKTYDRKLPHKFVLYNHRKTKREDERLARYVPLIRNRWWWRWTPTRYFGDARHVALEYMNQRVDLMSVSDRSKAQAICAKLGLCSQSMDVSTDVAPEDVHTPRADWAEGSGDLPGDL